MRVLVYLKVELWPMAKLVLKQSIKAHGPHVVLKEGSLKMACLISQGPVYCSSGLGYWLLRSKRCHYAKHYAELVNVG